MGSEIESSSYDAGALLVGATNEDPVRAAARAALLSVQDESIRTDREFFAFILRVEDRSVIGPFSIGEPGCGCAPVGPVPSNAIGEIQTQGALSPGSERPSGQDIFGALSRARLALREFGQQTFVQFVATPGNRLFELRPDIRASERSSSNKPRFIGPLDVNNPIIGPGPR